ncbi:MAG: site-specific DNA-methyltransferase, partial [Deltaproteobacteria bacterium]|nr:site-specific DNA-methyltransferase [Deltaproteobacteria bacterium]
ARTRPLTSEEAEILAKALRKHEPWLEWAGKQEKKSFEVDPVALHIHERISAQAILKVLAREDVQRSLFADPQLEYRKAVQFYQHDVDWSNRMILGDSLQVMASLAKREGLAGKVQMIYMDPPYGIKFSSNFQPEIGKRDVKDKESDLTREPEMVKAYRDTWTLGVHSYLAYLRDRLILCKELLSDSGSIFVQIGEENAHRIRLLMDGVFGAHNIVSLIAFQTTSASASGKLDSVYDMLLWYARDKNQLKYRQVYESKSPDGHIPSAYNKVYLPWGESMGASMANRVRPTVSDLRLYALDNITSSRPAGEGDVKEFSFGGRVFTPGRGTFKTDEPGLTRLAKSGKIEATADRIGYVRYVDDFPAIPIANIWTDTVSSFMPDKIYVVQTNRKVIERCILMATDPGDLVLDPTCGSGTTAYVAEQWGRRWITIDTSRVALALARQRLLTASFPYYRVKDETPTRDPSRQGRGDTSGGRSREGIRIEVSPPLAGGDQGVGEERQMPNNPGKGFNYRTVPHITLRSIAQNVALDPIFARHELLLEGRLKKLNAALKKVTPSLRQKLLAKLAAKERAEGKKAITDGDRRRWQLPKDEWKEWEIPFDTDEDWPAELKTALTEYRNAWRAKMDEVNACIAANAEQEELVDQPEVVRVVSRVSGPFTMEAVMPIEQSLLEPSPIGGEPEELETFGEHTPPAIQEEPANAEAYLDKMLRLLKADGVRFPNNKILQFSRLERYSGEYLHGEGEWQTENGQVRKVAVSFGPEFGPVTAFQVENAIPMAARRGFDDLVFAGFSFDAAAQAIIQEDPNPKIRCHLAHIRPDVNMGRLLKETPNSQLFTVFGSPRTNLRQVDDGMYVVEMEGVDIYNPVDNTILPTSANKVAAWFLDTDWDGRTFCITQAFFPDKSAWAKIGRSLKGVIDEERFAALSGTVSLPFPPGKKGWAAVKVIDPRGNEVMSLHRLPGKGGAGYEQE